jgi:uncharacterized protein (TIGR00266 family)
MHHVFRHDGSVPLLQVSLAPSESLSAESGSLVARDGTVTMTVEPNAPRASGWWGWTKALLVALARKLLGQRSLFLSRFHAPVGGWVWIAPPMNGAIRHFALGGERLVVDARSYLAHSGPLDLRPRRMARGSRLAEQGRLYFEAVGEGDLWISAYGAIEEILVVGVHVVDTGHLVAFDASLQLETTPVARGAKEAFGSGEGLVCKLVGDGRAYVQTRTAHALVAWLDRQLH